MEYMVKYAPAEGGVMLQTEDEISACTMAIGAAYAGARAFTATAGPGLSLMAEAIGLAEMTETPLVRDRYTERRPQHPACRPSMSSQT